MRALPLNLTRALSLRSESQAQAEDHSRKKPRISHKRLTNDAPLASRIAGQPCPFSIGALQTQAWPFSAPMRAKKGPSQAISVKRGLTGPDQPQGLDWH